MCFGCLVGGFLVFVLDCVALWVLGLHLFEFVLVDSCLNLLVLWCYGVGGSCFILYNGAFCVIACLF